MQVREVPVGARRPVQRLHVGNQLDQVARDEARRETEVPREEWAAPDEREAVERLTDASNDVGLTGVVFLRDIETHEPGEEEQSPTDTVTVRVKTNRPLSPPETELVRAKLLDR